MRPVLLIVAFFASLIPISGANAVIFGADRRMTIATPPGSLFAPVGIVYGAPESEYATAFLVDDCHALTVQHAFGDQRSAKGRQITFAVNVDGPAASWTTTRGRVVAEGGIETRPRSGVTGRIDDWALIRLRKCLGRIYGHVRLSARLPGTDEAIGIAGYPSDRPLTQGVSIDTNCHIHGMRSLAILHDCAALPGNSGGPLFRIGEENGRPILEVFAMLEAAHSASDIGRNVMDVRDNYPDAVWNVATALCANGPLAAARMAVTSAICDSDADSTPAETRFAYGGVGTSPLARCRLRGLVERCAFGTQKQFQEPPRS